MGSDNTTLWYSKIVTENCHSQQENHVEMMYDPATMLDYPFLILTDIDERLIHYQLSLPRSFAVTYHKH